MFNEADDEEEDALASIDSDLDGAMESSMELRGESSRKRKREQLDENDHPTTPSSSMPRVDSPAGPSRNELDEPVSDLSEPNALEQTKDNVDHKVRIPGRSGPSFTGYGQAFLEVAQLIAHQAVCGLVQLHSDFFEEANRAGERVPDRSLQNTMIQLLSAFFPNHKRCSLKDYVSLGEKSPSHSSREQATLNQRSFKPTHVAGVLGGVGQPIFKLDSPYTRIRRNGISTEISASALAFWEQLGLGPSYESKDVNVFCLCPKNRHIEKGVVAFLNMIKGAYQSCNLGSHDHGSSLADHNKRIFTAPMDAGEPDNFVRNIADTCEDLGTWLTEVELQSGRTVIYIINPFNNQRYLPKLCEALLRLPKSYRAALDKRRPERQSDLALQLVPLELVWSPERIVVPSPAVYRKLAFEVYNCFGSTENGRGQDPYFISAPAVRLAKAVPKTLDFKLVSESSAPFVQSDNCLHVSYTWDATNEWLAVWWTDNLGVLSWRACYCLGINDETPWKPFYEASREILETCFDMLHPPNAPWRLFICKDGPVLKMENDGNTHRFPPRPDSVTLI